MITDSTAAGDVGEDWRLKWLAAMAVLCVAITWGVSFAVVKATVGKVSPSRLSVGASRLQPSPCSRYDLGFCKR